MTVETIDDDDELLRRFVRSHLRADGSINSALFKSPSTGVWDRALSFDLERLSSPSETAARAGRPGFGVARLAAAVPKQLDYAVRHDPSTENPAHVLVEGETNQERAWILAESMRVAIHPDR